MINRDLLCELAADYGVALNAAALDKFERYAALLVEWNQKMNLTAITDPLGITVKHFADSVAAVPLLPEKQGLSVIDVGTGAGFPGIPFAIVRPDIRLTLLDSLNKRLIFLEEVCRELDIPVQRIHARAEEGGRKPELREQFDVATARAVAGLPVLLEYCLPFVKVGGRFVALKGPDSDDEHRASAAALTKLGGKTADVHKLLLPKTPREGLEQQERRIFVFEKTKQTPSAYPRASAKIAKVPL
ncbi:MAG: 16S rRNA (guanine(527)-N(7))-methyltransferase RsmG [Clostridia bacterium]|nr:16S rRNA (guanine(527)-N(7))-methyltransferase RsmG [Clostridia bacterium]